jgi:hypothetical protein
MRKIFRGFSLKRELVEKYRNSRLTVPKFCDQEGINVHTFRSWLYKGKKNNQKYTPRKKHRENPSFIPGPASTDIPVFSTSSRVIIECPGGIWITIEG